jgi:triosephosphate isomerase
MTAPKLYVAGNWKMNGLKADLKEIEAVKAGVSPSDPDVAFFPPATLLPAAAAVVAGSPVEVGGQDCSPQAKGAYTGDLSADILKDAGATAIIVGHSERRHGHGESSQVVSAKASAALKTGVKAVICIGELISERQAGLAVSVCSTQVTESLPAESTPETVIVAYEPVWAIGTGLSPTTPDITEIHNAVREKLHELFPASAGKRWRVLYGGSVTAANAAEIFTSPEVDGVLVGGASLKADSFLKIIDAARNSKTQRGA